MNYAIVCWSFLIYFLIGYGSYYLIPYFSLKTRQKWEKDSSYYDEESDETLDKIEKLYNEEGKLLLIGCILLWLPVSLFIAFTFIIGKKS